MVGGGVERPQILLDDMSVSGNWFAMLRRRSCPLDKSNVPEACPFDADSLATRAGTKFERGEALIGGAGFLGYGRDDDRDSGDGSLAAGTSACGRIRWIYGPVSGQHGVG